MCISLLLFLVSIQIVTYSRYCSQKYVKLPLFQKAEENFNPIELILTFVFVSWSFLIIFFLCEFGERLSGKFDAIDEELYQCTWYLFPMGMQRMVLTLMLGTQEPVFLRGFGNIVCTREAFKEV